MNVVFLYQDPHTHNSFYAQFVALMKVAAASLGISLEVIRCLDPDEQRRKGLALCGSPKKPDYMILTNTRGAAKRVLETATKSGIKVFVSPEGFSQLERSSVGEPQGKHARWIGELIPDEEHTGYTLAAHLLREAFAKNMFAPDGKVHLIALSGVLTPAASARANGLRKAIAEHPAGAVLDDILPARWDEDRATRLVDDALGRHPHTSVIWAANDQMALGAVTAIKNQGKQPGTDILVGGIDWLPAALRSIERGEITTSIGGHIIDGMFVLILLYDDYHNHQLPQPSLSSQLHAATAENARSCLQLYDERSLKGVTFSSFSKVGNPTLHDYGFSAASLLRHLS